MYVNVENRREMETKRGGARGARTKREEEEEEEKERLMKKERDARILTGSATQLAELFEKLYTYCPFAKKVSALHKT
uniref:Uncharacterized protein n=1 Tax=Caenorhabditis japonica TaxID=281687 RepID=A0A8R1E350_CAEJA